MGANDKALKEWKAKKAADQAKKGGKINWFQEDTEDDDEYDDDDGDMHFSLIEHGSPWNDAIVGNSNGSIAPTINAFGDLGEDQEDGPTGGRVSSDSEPAVEKAAPAPLNPTVSIHRPSSSSRSRSPPNEHLRLFTNLKM